MRALLKLALTGLLLLAGGLNLVPVPALAGGIVAVESKPLAPDFELQSLTGNPVKLSDLKGKVVLVNFWASWCAPCRAEMPSMERLWKKMDKENFTMLAINAGQEKSDIAKFFFSLRKPITFPVLIDARGSASQYWPIKALPVTFIIDKEGRVAYVSHGAKRWDSKKVRALLQQLIGEARVADTKAGEETADEKKKVED